MLNASKHEAGRKIRSPFRVVIDDDVDRAQVYRWRHHSRALLIARGFLPVIDAFLPLPGIPWLSLSFFFRSSLSIALLHVRLILGGYSAGVPPLPIPNREVKPGHADGTAHKVGE